MNPRIPPKMLAVTGPFALVLLLAAALTTAVAGQRPRRASRPGAIRRTNGFATAAALCSVTAKPGSVAAARSANNWTDSI